MKKTKLIVFWTAILMVISIFVLIRPLNNLEEIWNFNIARMIGEGLIPYKQISMITTPFAGFITALVLKIFGNELFYTRILTIFLEFGALLLIHKILKKLNIKDAINFISIFLITILFKDYFYLDYNTIILTFSLLITYLEIKFYDNNSAKFNIAIGALGGISICTKQTIGILISIVILFNKLFFIKNKTDIKKYLKVMLYRLLGIAIPLLILAIYLIINKSFYDFISYCFIGIKNFNNYIPYKSLVCSSNWIIKILSRMAPLIIVASVVTNIVFKWIKKEDNVFYQLTIYCLPIFLIIYPIADENHFIIAIIPLIILIIYLVKMILKKVNFKLPDVTYLYNLAATIVVILVTGFVFYTEIKYEDQLGNLSKYKQINHFNYITLENLDAIEQIKEIDNYICNSEKNVYVIDSNAAIYMIPINRYNKNYDMLIKGGFGKQGEDQIIENIKNENAKYLVLNDKFTYNWKIPTDIVVYIKSNLEYKETVKIFDVYENKV